jgi:hypothetical protein
MHKRNNSTTNKYFINQDFKLMKNSLSSRNLNEINPKQNNNYKIIINNPINLNEINQYLINFYNQNGISNNQSSINILKNNIIEIKFNNFYFANDFLNILNNIKLSSSNYKNMNFKLVKDSNKINIINNTEPTNKKSRNKIKLNYLNSSIKNNETNPNISFKLNLNNINYNYMDNKLFNSYNNYNNVKDIIIDPITEKENKKLIYNYFKNQVYIRNSSPYIDNYEKKKEEEKKNKEKFLYHKNFFTSVGHYSMKPYYIKNYVSQTPSESPLNYKFRKTNKSKWIIKKGFIL